VRDDNQELEFSGSFWFLGAFWTDLKLNNKQNFHGGQPWPPFFCFAGDEVTSLKLKKFSDSSRRLPRF
jgi:hypothetical protein